MKIFYYYISVEKYIINILLKELVFNNLYIKLNYKNTYF